MTLDTLNTIIATLKDLGITSPKIVIEDTRDGATTYTELKAYVNKNSKGNFQLVFVEK